MRTMRTCQVVALLLALMGCPVSMLGESKEVRDSTVHLIVVDGLGAKLHGGEIKSFLSKRTGQDLASRFHLDKFQEEVATAIPVGEYQLRVNQPGFPVASRVVQISKSDEWVYVSVRTAIVHVIDVGSMHESNGNFKVASFINVDDGNEFASAFHNNTAMDIPYGIYELVASMPFAHTVKRQVYVFKPEVWVFISLELSPVSLPEYLSPREVITGEVTNINPEDEPIYVTLVGLHVPYTIDDMLVMSGSSGTFKLAGV